MHLLVLLVSTHEPCPPALFKRYRKYGVAVFMCEHHGVKEYIEVVVKSCREWLNKVTSKLNFRQSFILSQGEVKKLVVQFCDEQHATVHEQAVIALSADYIRGSFGKNYV